MKLQIGLQQFENIMAALKCALGSPFYALFVSDFGLPGYLQMAICHDKFWVVLLLTN